jgi:RNA polymerase sigma-70 factor (ECF subfamily)
MHPNSRPLGTALDDAIAEFIDLRPRLHGIAHRILGCHADAEDVVQDAWIRWQTCNRTQVRSSTAFLVTVTTRLAINAAQSARARRESPVGDWFPDLVDSGSDPTEEAEQQEAMARGISRLLERLSPDERTAFILRQGFDYPYPAIAEMLGLTQVNARQLVSRAGKRLSTPVERPVEKTVRRRRVAAAHAGARHGDAGELEQQSAA